MGAERKSLGEVLFGRTRSQILAMLYGRPEQSFFGREIVRGIHGGAGAVQRELTTLTKLGLVTRSVSGRQVFYRANVEHPAFPDMRALLAKTTGIFGVLADALETLRDRIQYAFVYGSFARGEETASSDVDLMVIGSLSLDELLEHLAPKERSLGRVINPSVYSLREFKAKLKAKNHYLQAVQRGKSVFLVGDEHEFRAIR